MRPRPMVTGSISRSTCRTAGSRHVERHLEPEVESSQDRDRDEELDDRADQDAERVGVELVVAVEERLRSRRAG